MEQQPEEAAAQDQEDHHPLLILFDTYWFYHPILSYHPPPPPPPTPTPPPPPPPVQPSPPPPPPPPAPIKVVSPTFSRPLHRRSLSAELATSVGLTELTARPKLHTILSGKEDVISKDNSGDGSNEVIVTRTRKGRKKRRSESSRSLSDLEFEELKGFMDLGFTFSDAESDPRIMSLVPGLQRKLGQRTTSSEELTASQENIIEKTAISRPYLSEAWEAREDEEGKKDFLMKWRIPSAAEGEDMKDQLRLWAQTVASFVR